MRRILAILLLSCLLLGVLAPAALADSVRVSNVVIGGKAVPSQEISSKGATVVAGQPFVLTFTYTYSGPELTEMGRIFAVDSSVNITVAISQDDSYGYLRAMQVTSKSHDVYAATGHDVNTGLLVEEHGPITVTVSGTAPKESFFVSFTPRGQASMPIPVSIKSR